MSWSLRHSASGRVAGPAERGERRHVRRPARRVASGAIRLTRPHSTLPGPTSRNASYPPPPGRRPTARSAPARRAGAAAGAAKSRSSKREAAWRRRTAAPARTRRSPRAARAGRRRRHSTSGEWKAPLTASRMTALRARGASRASAQPLDAADRAADDDLAGAVVVGRPHVVDAGAELVDGLVVEAEHGDHGARRVCGGGGHGLAAALHEAHGVGEVERVGGHQRRVLAEAVAEGGVEGEARARSAPGGCATECDEQRRLRDVGLAEVWRPAPRSRAPRGRSRARRSPRRRWRARRLGGCVESRPMPTACEPWPGNMRRACPRATGLTELPLREARAPGQTGAEADHQQRVALLEAAGLAWPRADRAGSTRTTCCRSGRGWRRPAPR